MVIGYHIPAQLAKMPAIKFNKKQLDTVRGLLQLGLDSGQVSKRMKSNGVIISTRYIRTIRSKMQNEPLKQFKEKNKRGPKFKLNSRQVAHLKNFLLRSHPPALSWLGAHFGLSKCTIRNYRCHIWIKII